MANLTAQVKVCGLTSVEQAVGCANAGVDAIGLNFWEGTPRCVEADIAREIVEAVGGTIEIVGVFVNASIETIEQLRAQVGFEWVQLHGDETPAVLQALQPKSYKAVGIAETRDLAAVDLYPGARILLDARVPGAMPGGTGTRFDWELAVEVARRRELTLAGGLNPENVADAIDRVRPHRVDVASGVESAPGIKDMRAVEAFVVAARRAISPQLGG